MWRAINPNLVKHLPTSYVFVLYSVRILLKCNSVTAAKKIIILVSITTKTYIYQNVDKIWYLLMCMAEPAEPAEPSPSFARYSLSNFDTTLEGTPDDMTVVDAASLRRQVCKTCS